MSATLRTAAEDRLATLRQEIKTGNDTLAQMEQRRAALTEMLLRIAGAVQVLEEILQTIEEETTLCQNPNGAECMTLPSV
jgi:predicted nuclease with TOPRIM domain